jgi:CRISPR-associated protein Csm1
MQSRVDSKVKDLINNFKNEVCDKQAACLNGVPIESDYHPLELWALAARWAELEERTNNK